ncbi:hypothetical protein J5U23_01388 [Saccharolobus shibatae B12]|uniref:Uncharacterized protein n=1 Tax=Saccharolobus shibatae (strain ATCC 51178 / DSM 5389 / JCM 8931 / NBRC 15437 / B12) TaxID=523848 RepID=A0A8F5BND3_SACSH|nr:hypothetical protein [Saccharolobus shibatae]QXJ28519.1 hypothetical protein J5U23_01388 [Saccharolobus shibatae B12]
MRDEKINIVLRILWKGGVTRVAVEEARNMKSTLVVYRHAGTQYDLSNVDLKVLFAGEPKWIFKVLTSISATFSLFTYTSKLYGSFFLKINHVIIKNYFTI